MAERDDVARARRIEVYVYVAAGVSLVLLGMVLTSKIMNWIVGPAYIVAFVTIVTPLALRAAGVRDPDRGSYERWRTAREVDPTIGAGPVVEGEGP